MNAFQVEESHIEGVCFAGADLTDADLSNSKWNDVDFRKAILQRTKFEGAQIFGRMDCRGSDMSGANFRNARLHSLLIDENTIVDDADFTGAKVKGGTTKGLWLIVLDGKLQASKTP